MRHPVHTWASWCCMQSELVNGFGCFVVHSTKTHNNDNQHMVECRASIEGAERPDPVELSIDDHQHLRIDCTARWVIVYLPELTSRAD